jgi:signal peptidase II
MKFKKTFRILLILIVILANVGCDQLSKHLVRQNMLPGQTIPLAGGHFIVTSVENTGAFLSLGDSLAEPLKQVLLSLLPLLAVIGCIIYMLFKPHIARWPLLAFCCILGGGLGNILDRIRYGSVTDFMHIDLYLLKTGIFNIADVSIMTGICILAVGIFFNKGKEDLQNA